LTRRWEKDTAVPTPELWDRFTKSRAKLREEEGAGRHGSQTKPEIRLSKWNARQHKGVPKSNAGIVLVSGVREFKSERGEGDRRALKSTRHFSGRDWRIVQVRGNRRKIQVP